MTRKEAIISIQKQIEAATHRKIRASYIGYLLQREGDQWQVEHRGVIYSRTATDQPRSSHGESKQSN